MVFNSFDMMSIVYIYECIVYTVNYDMDYCIVHSVVCRFFFPPAFGEINFSWISPLSAPFVVNRTAICIFITKSHIFSLLTFPFALCCVCVCVQLFGSYYTFHCVTLNSRHFFAPITNISSFINRFVKCKKSNNNNNDVTAILSSCCFVCLLLFFLNVNKSPLPSSAKANIYSFLSVKLLWPSIKASKLMIWDRLVFFFRLFRSVLTKGPTYLQHHISKNCSDLFGFY